MNQIYIEMYLSDIAKIADYATNAVGYLSNHDFDLYEATIKKVKGIVDVLVSECESEKNSEIPEKPTPPPMRNIKEGEVLL